MFKSVVYAVSLASVSVLAFSASKHPSFPKTAIGFEGPSTLVKINGALYTTKAAPVNVKKACYGNTNMIEVTPITPGKANRPKIAFDFEGDGKGKSRANYSMTFKYTKNALTKVYMYHGKSALCKKGRSNTVLVTYDKQYKVTGLSCRHS